MDDLVAGVSTGETIWSLCCSCDHCVLPGGGGGGGSCCFCYVCINDCDLCSLLRRWLSVASVRTTKCGTISLGDYQC